MIALHLIESYRGGSPGMAAFQSPCYGFIQLQGGAAGQDQGTLDNIFQFPHISEPGICLQGVHYLLRNGIDCFSQGETILVNEVFGKIEDILFALAKRGQNNGKNIEPVV